MKFKLLLMLVFFGFNCFAQKQGRITYKLKINEDNFLTKNDLSKKIVSDSENLTFILDFREEEMLFFCQENLHNQGNTAIGISGVYNPIYYNATDKLVVYNSPSLMVVEEDEFLITNSDALKWEISGENKKISNYTCLKATAKRKKETSKGVIEEVITAWFCPSIPVKFSPKGYTGLPGLVFEVHEKFCAFVLEKIDFNYNPTIRKPSKGKKISTLNYNKLLKERNDLMRKEVEKKK